MNDSPSVETAAAAALGAESTDLASSSSSGPAIVVVGSGAMKEAHPGAVSALLLGGVAVVFFVFL